MLVGSLSMYLKMCMKILKDFLKADEYLIFVKPLLLKVNNWDYSYIYRRAVLG